MTHAVETMAWKGAIPWHGLGVEVRADVTAEEMMVAAGLDWEVRKYPMFTSVAGKTIQVPQRMALVRETDHKIMTVTGPDWTPIQNKEIFEFFKGFAEAGQAELETAGSLHGGKVIWALASIKTGFTLNGNDTTRGYVLMVSPHEVGKSTLMATTAVRVVCANTLAMALGSLNKQASYRQSHVKDFDYSKAAEVVGLAKEQIAALELEANALNSLKLSDYDTVRFLAQFFVDKPDDQKEEEFVNQLLDDAGMRPKQMNAIIDSLYDAPGAIQNTGWGVLNAVTHWADHTAGNKADARLASAWFGERAELKLEVKGKLLELVQ